MTDAAEHTGPNEAEQRDDGVSEVERLASEGQMIARSVLIMRVKNRIIVEVMGRQRNLPQSHYDEIVVEELLQLADETLASAEQLEATISIVRTKGTYAYRGNPAENLDPESLDLRRRTALELEARLRRQRDDELFRAEVASQARQAAMDEMFRARMLHDVAIPPSQDDPVERNERLLDLASDLQRQRLDHERRERRRERWNRVKSFFRLPTS